MKIAVIYARYSSDRQTEQSIEGQLRVCHEYAERNDIAIVDTFIDRAMTGTNDKRVSFQKMLKDSNKKAWDYVLVYKLDRFSRNKYETAMHKRKLKDNGIKVISATENIPDTPEGIILESLLEGMSEYYSAELSQKVRRGMRETRKKGNFSGGTIPFGYKKEGKKLVIDEDQATIVKHIFNEYASGKLVTTIVDELNEKGITNRGKVFVKNTVYKMLRNEEYTGIYHFQNEVYDNIYPRIIQQDLFEIVQTRISNNRYGKHKPDINYLLKNKIKCGYCGNNVGSDCGTSKTGKSWRYYNCNRKKKPKTCKLKAVGKEILENLVVDTLLETMSDDMIEYISEQILEIHEKKMNDNSILNILLKDYAQVEKQINNLLEAILKGIYTESTKARLEQLEKEKAKISHNIKLEQSKEKLRLTQNDIIKFMKKAIAKRPQVMIDLLIKEIILYNDKIEIFLLCTDKEKPDDKNHQVSSFYTTTKIVDIGNSQTANNTFKITLFV